MNAFKTLALALASLALANCAATAKGEFPPGSSLHPLYCEQMKIMQAKRLNGFYPKLVKASGKNRDKLEALLAGLDGKDNALAGEHRKLLAEYTWLEDQWVKSGCAPLGFDGDLKVRGKADTGLKAVPPAFRLPWDKGNQ